MVARSAGVSRSPGSRVRAARTAGHRLRLSWDEGRRTRSACPGGPLRASPVILRLATQAFIVSPPGGSHPTNTWLQSSGAKLPVRAQTLHATTPPAGPWPRTRGSRGRATPRVDAACPGRRDGRQRGATRSNCQSLAERRMVSSHSPGYARSRPSRARQRVKSRCVHGGAKVVVSQEYSSTRRSRLRDDPTRSHWRPDSR
jgi:hypothetical protein